MSVRRASMATWIAATLFSCHAFGNEDDPRAAAQRQAAAKLREIVDNVQTSEKLYENIEIKLDSNYRLERPPFDSPDLVKTGEKKARFVFQGGMYYFRNDERLVDRAGKEQRPDTLQGFDGETTRIVEQNAIANLRKGRAVEPRLALPFNAIFEGVGITFPLSTFLRGGAEVKKQDGFRNARVEVNYLGDEAVDGLLCHKLRIDYWLDSWKDKTPNGADARYVWLSPDRNYLPVKTSFFLHPHPAGERPAEVGISGDFREISPGVWFPFDTKVTVYSLGESHPGEEPAVNNFREFKVEKAELDPHYEVDFFRDIPFPDGILVYVIENDKIVRKYLQGGVRPTEPAAARSWNPAAWAGIGIGAIALVALGHRFWRSSRPKVPA